MAARSEDFARHHESADDAGYGLFAKFSKEIRHSDVRMLVVRQSFLQRLFGVGGIDVSSAASDESDIRISGIAHPEKVKEVIDSLRP